ncbi:TetR/AcrR family transcriptional regulator [Dactylosporangium sp. AC04546]|uniref:TetR/AcrR family transcriptional regulator n=1 Tax=Dactylosporangium sp. AC04546 TaxID=2862460 RepID=UPI001EDD4694|nr:TetR/AcrR family transcriptional regulator [Dactylosporangium sp. AC04546]WVK87146.1 TetR/AcrR family transcriptional regulator [Dactylosporangium sp. AC04546]
MTRTGRSAARPRGAWRRPGGPQLSHILNGALDAFYEVGFHGTTVRDIAERVGLTVPALYYHHRNKEAILAALLDHSISEVICRCEQALDEAGPDPRSRFENLIACLVLYMSQHRKSAAMDAEIRALGPENRKAYSAKRMVVERKLIDAIEAGVAAGDFEVDFPKETARALLGMCQAITVWYDPAGRVKPEALARRYQVIALRTVVAATAEPSR